MIVITLDDYDEKGMRERSVTHTHTRIHTRVVKDEN